MKRSGIDVHGGDGRTPAYGGVAQRSVQPNVLVRNGDELGRDAALARHLGNRFLVKADLGTRRKKDVLDTSKPHRRYDGFAHISNRGDMDPGAVFIAHARVFQRSAASFAQLMAWFTRSEPGLTNNCRQCY
jgi:hypothetical protein